MPDSKITALASTGTGTDPANDPLVIVDVSDTSMAATGTTKKVTLNQLLACSPTATLASATITGDLTVRTNKLAVNTNGVGIGTTNPFFPLVVNGTDTTNVLFNGITKGVRFSASASASAITGVDNTGSVSFQPLTIGGSTLDFSLSGTTAMTLNTSGLGIGVTPTYKLQSVGIAAATSSTINGSGGYVIGALLNSDDANSNVNPGVDLRRWTGTALNHGTSYIATNSTGDTLFYNGAVASNTRATSLKMTLDASGNLGIGVTPSAWASNRKALQIGGLASAALALNGTSNVSELFFNSFINTSANNVYAVNGRAGLIAFGSAGYTFGIDSGTQIAGANCTFTNAMTLDASGNLILLSPSTPPTLTTNGQLTVNATSNTNLRFSYRGSDGTTRVANITLA